MRVRIAATVGQSCREVERKVLEGWLRLSGEDFERFVDDICGWGIDGGNVLVPPNKENEAKGTVVRENVQFDRESSSLHRRFPFLSGIALQTLRLFSLSLSLSLMITGLQPC